MFSRGPIGFLVSTLLIPSLLLSTERPKPKLVVAIIVDQFRYDYLTRFSADYHGGLHQLMTQGANFTNAFYQQMPTVTAVGHSIFMSGAMPSVSGIVSNAWYDRQEGKVVTSVCDWDTKTVGGLTVQKTPACADSDPASPKRLLVSSLGDELRDAHPASTVIGVSIKARGAILPSGHRAKAAYWFDDATGNFVTSTFYLDALPEYATAFNNRKLAAEYVTKKWDGFPAWDFRGAPASPRPYDKIPASPWGNELIEQFAEAAITGEQLGQHESPDLLTISFSSNDYVGHAVGPNAPEVRDMSIRTDQLLRNLFALLDQKVGMSKVLVVLSADHGVAPTPAEDAKNKMPGDYIYASVDDVVTSALSQKFGSGEWLMPSASDSSIYLNYETIARMKMPDGRPVNKADVLATAKDAILGTPALYAARVYTKDQLDNGVTGDFIATAASNSYYPRRSGDLTIVYQPFYMSGSSGTTHFSPYAYDRHVPMLFMGPGIKPGRYDRTVAGNDVAPTLATMLDIQTPSGSSGRVLTEMLQ